MRLLHLLAFGLLSFPAFSQNDNYGADKANKRNIPASNLLGGKEDFEYLALKDHPSRSGVPLGGIGAGNVQFAPNGRFVRIGLNNIHQPIANSRDCFFALWTPSGSRRLVRDNDSSFGMKGLSHTSYTGLFPRATLQGESENVKVNIHAWSSLVPHDIKNSSLPVAYFDVELEATENTVTAIAFSWEDFIGKGIKDPLSVEGMDGQVLSRSALLNGEEWPERKPIATFSEAFNGAGFKGVRQFTPAPIIPVKATFQNYVQEVALMAVQTPGTSISMLPAFEQSGWESFVKNGAFPEYGGKRQSLSKPGATAGSAVAVKTSLKKGEKKTIRFILVWFFPELKIDKENAVPGSYWAGGSDYGRYFHNYFSSLSSVATYSLTHHNELLAKTMEWQQPVLQSTLPDWYKFKLINSGYVIYTNMILNKKGDVTVNEGGMGGLAGTMDQRISSHPFYQKFFTQLDRSEMQIFGDAQAFDGSINHFIGHYYVGMGTVGGRVPTENHWMLDNTEGWIIQIVKDYEQTGDLHYLQKFAGRMKDGMKFLKSKMPPGVAIPIGPTTYDDFTHPPIYSYGAGMYLAALKAASTAAKALKDTAWAIESEQQLNSSRKAVLQMLWNGRFFSYGCQVDGTGRLDNILFTGQLAGSFVSRYAGWGDVIPLPYVQASLVSQFKISLSKTPDYYANKVWDMQLGKGIDQRGSQCWPFYLESYTAYPAIQAGFVADGMDIMKHIQLVHLRRGLTWSQNLWNPGNITYMTAPVTWFSTDVLAGAGVNLPAQEIRLAPVLKDSATVTYPLYFPTFWATLQMDNVRKTASLKIIKTFGDTTFTLSKLVVEAAGTAADQKKCFSLPAFRIVKGGILDLSKWHHELNGANTAQAVLPRADKVEFRTVQ